jgi:hypothetical protein
MNYYQVKVLVSDLEIFNINAQNETIAKIKALKKITDPNQDIDVDDLNDNTIYNYRVKLVSIKKI